MNRQIDAVDTLSPQLFGSAYEGLSWTYMRGIVKAIEGRYTECSPEEAAAVREFTARTRFPTRAVAEAVLAGGRSVGKTTTEVHFACSRALRTYKRAPGERIKSILTSPTVQTSQNAHARCLALMEASPITAAMIQRVTGTTIELTTGCDIECRAANFAHVRGPGCCFVGVDELAFLPTDDGANPDRELLRAFRPALARVEGSLLLLTSTVYAQRGELWRYLKEGYGRD